VVEEQSRRVVITGLGAVTPLGNDWPTTWSAIVGGANGVGPITLFDASTFPSSIAAEVKDFDPLPNLLHPKHIKFLNRFATFGLAAAREAVDDAKLNPEELEPTRFGVVIGAGQEKYNFLDLAEFVKLFGQEYGVDYGALGVNGWRVANPNNFLKSQLNLTSSLLAMAYGAHGLNLTVHSACASSQSIGDAYNIIRRGDLDVAITGGVDSMIDEVSLTGFCLLQTLSTRNEDPARASRPFDLNRDGFVLGEGAGVMVLESLEHALARGAPIWGEILGYGSSSNAFRITDIPPDGAGAVVSMRLALEDAGLSPHEIDYVNAHGTSTKMNDSSETRALRRVFGERADGLPTSSTKSQIGHLISAAGAVELMACISAMEEGIVPPTINYETPDPECDLDYVPNEARPQVITTALSNSFGFGGSNCSIIVGRYKP
jgi:3-oxoacyl-[acyl-carrier-protein] synthase II